MCATRRYQPCGMKGPACRLSQQPAEAGSSLALEAQGWVGAAPGTHSYTRVLEGDIKACFDEIDHTALMGRVRHRTGDKRSWGW